MDFHIFALIFGMIFVAELPDKTAFAAFLLAARGKSRAVFLGAASAFCIQSLVAVGCGHLVSLMPEKWVHAGAGVLFIGMAAYSWIFESTEDEVPSQAEGMTKAAAFLQVAWKSFLVIFVAEWGDMTQLATVSFAARYPAAPVTVFSAATLALWAVTGLAVFAGKKVGSRLPLDKLQRAAALLFGGIGVYFVVTALI